MKFTRIPIQVEAIQFISDEPEDNWPEGVECDTFGIAIMQERVVKDGDWIVTEPDGARYPVKAALFPTLYDKVPE